MIYNEIVKTCLTAMQSLELNKFLVQKLRRENLGGKSTPGYARFKKIETELPKHRHKLSEQEPHGIRNNWNFQTLTSKQIKGHEFNSQALTSQRKSNEA